MYTIIIVWISYFLYYSWTLLLPLKNYLFNAKEKPGKFWNPEASP